MNGKKAKTKISYSRNSAQYSRRAEPIRSSQMSADERIVSRTNARRRRNRRKKLIIRTVLGSFFLVAALVLVLVLFFNINNITVSGDDIYSDADVVAASNVKIGDNLIFVSAKKINSKITETLPYAGSVKIKRRLPATLEIVVTKTVAEYAIMTDGAYALLDSNGKVLEKGLDFVGENMVVANLGTVTSAEAGKILVLENEQIFDKLMKLKSAFLESGITGITSVDITNTVYSTHLRAHETILNILSRIL
ncbi:MAG: FtsQ-type POTRA domain-containing protein, partial [Oscillospiraceae bacterium]|nr:FtsQ-type POTRA domain-containing protein [Oscillospiraceae bacterium]